MVMPIILECLINNLLGFLRLYQFTCKKSFQCIDLSLHSHSGLSMFESTFGNNFLYVVSICSIRTCFRSWSQFKETKGWKYFQDFYQKQQKKVTFLEKNDLKRRRNKKNSSEFLLEQFILYASTLLTIVSV